jgi:hypothetical protein
MVIVLLCDNFLPEKRVALVSRGISEAALLEFRVACMNHEWEGRENKMMIDLSAG